MWTRSGQRLSACPSRARGTPRIRFGSSKLEAQSESKAPRRVQRDRFSDDGPIGFAFQRRRSIHRHKGLPRSNRRRSGRLPAEAPYELHNEIEVALTQFGRERFRLFDMHIEHDAGIASRKLFNDRHQYALNSRRATDPDLAYGGIRQELDVSNSLPQFIECRTGSADGVLGLGFCPIAGRSSPTTSSRASRPPTIAGRNSSA
jgi:hypothetical protein